MLVLHVIVTRTTGLLQTRHLCHPAEIERVEKEIIAFALHGRVRDRSLIRFN